MEARLAQAIDPARAFAELTALADIGERVAGSPEEQAAGELIASRLAALGIEIERESFPIQRWHARAVELRAVSPEPFAVEARAVCFAGVLPPGSHRLPLRYAGTGRARDLAAPGLGGCALLLARDVYRDYPDTALVEAIAPAGPAALLFTASPGHRGGIPTVFYNFRDRERAPPPPCVTVAFDDAVRLVQSGTTEIELRLEAEVTPGSSANILGSLRGTDLAHEIVTVCAHHDAAPTSPGACDNAGGVACVLELARVAAARRPFRRSLVFASWGSHETGMHGSEAHLGRALAERRAMIAAVNFDTVGLAVAEDRLNVLGGPDWEAWVQGRVAPTGREPLVVPGPGYTDFTNFGAAAVPSVSLGQGFTNWNHTPGDCVERCAAHGLVEPLAVAAAILEGLVDGGGDHRAGFTAEQVAAVRAFNGRWGWSSFAPPP